MEFNNYTTIRNIGKGAQGVVILARDKRLGREVAIKSLHSNLINNPTQKNRFVEEAKVLAQLNHPNIVTLYDYLSNSEGHHLIMEHISGNPLDKIIELETGAINEIRSINIFLQVLEGISHIHSKGILHRDIKPSNIMLDKSDRVKLLDFGIAKNNLNDTSLTRIGSNVGGTPMYMSPEHVGSDDITISSDIYCLGVTLWQMVTGKVPYPGFSEAEINACILRDPLPNVQDIYPHVSSRMNDIIKTATSKNIKDRYLTCDDFINAIIGLKEDIINSPDGPITKIGSKVNVKLINTTNASIIINRVGVVGSELSEYILPGKKAKIYVNKEGFQIYVKQFTVNKDVSINVDLKKKSNINLHLAYLLIGILLIAIMYFFNIIFTIP